MVIPAAEGGATLLADDDSLGDPLNVKKRKWYWTAEEKYFFNNDESFYLRSKDDDDTHDNWVQLHPQEGYAHVGFHVDYDIYTNWCNARVFLEDNLGDKWRVT